jgi:hypothetical protein
MAAITGTYGLVKYFNIAFKVTLGSASDNVANADLFTTSGFAALAAVTPTNPLRTFLSTAWASDSAADTAFRALGGEINIRQVSGTATTVIAAQWTASSAVPSLTLTGGADQVLEIVIRCPISNIQ